MVRDFVKQAARAYQRKDFTSTRYFLFQAEWEIYMLDHFHTDSDLKAIKFLFKRIS